MELFIDEAGSFVSKDAKPYSWCVTGLYIYPENKKNRYKKVILNLKNRLKVKKNTEIKIHQISEDVFITFLKELNTLNGVFFATATDSYLNKPHLVKEHKSKIYENIKSNIPIMKYEEGKEATNQLAEKVNGISNQLYIQLHCQVQLILSFINRGIAYYVQRNPYSLSTFDWKIDRKEPKKILNYESAFEIIAPVLLQTISQKEPAIMIKNHNYKPMSKFIYKKGEVPEYLVEHYPYLNEEAGLNIQKIVRDNIEFVDSKDCEGIQVADLLSSGLRKLLRQEFDNNHLVAKYMGKLMVQNQKGKSVIKLLTFGKEEIVNNELKFIINILNENSKQMIK